MQIIFLPAKNINHSMQNTVDNIKKIDTSLHKIKIFVPDKLSLEMEKMIFKRLNIDCTFDIEVTTINRFCNKHLKKHDIDVKYLSKIGGIILTNKILNEKNINLKCLKKENFSYAYSSEIYKTLSQLKSCMTESESLQTFNSKNLQLQNKINDLGMLLNEYNIAKADLLDANDVITATILTLQDDEYKDEIFFFVGYDDYTFQGYAFIERLIQLCHSTYLCVYQNTDSKNRHIYPNQTYERLRFVATKLACVSKVIPGKLEQDNLHTYLTDNLFALSNLSYTTYKNEDVVLFGANTIDEEIEYVARKIREGVLNGYSFNEFGVCVYGLDKFADKIKRSFDKYEINYYIDTKHSLFNTELCRFVSAYLSLVQNNFDNDSLCDFCANALCPLTKDEKIKLLKYLQKTKRCGSFHSIELKTDENILDSIKKLNIIFDNINIDKTSKSKQILEDLNTLFANLSIESALINIANEIENLYEQKILMRSFDSLIEVLNEIETHYAESNLTCFIDILKNSSKEQSITPLPLSIDCVEVSDSNENFKTYKNLFIINCTKNTAPSVVQDCGIILDKEIVELHNTAEIAPSISYINKLAKFQLFNLAQCFDKSLTITMSIVDNYQKSELVNELQKRFFIAKHDTDETQILPLPIHSAIDYKYLPLSKIDYSEYTCDKNRNENNGVPYDKYLSEDNCDILLKKGYVSSSQLEKYFACPFYHFASYGLKLKEKEVADLQAFDFGNFMHELVKVYYESKKDIIDIQNFCKDFVSKKLPKSHYSKNLQFKNSLTNECLRLLTKLNYQDKNSQFVPTYFEFGLSEQNFFKTSELTLVSKVDRIDLVSDAFRIVDYKTGGDKPDFDDLYYGKKIQLFLYAMLTQKKLNLPCVGVFYLPIRNKFTDNADKMYSLQGFYLNDLNVAKLMDIRLGNEEFLKSDIINIELKKDLTFKKCEYSLTKSEFEKIYDYVDALCQQAIVEIKKGYIEPSPATKNNCKYCPYLQLCKKNSLKINCRKNSKIKKSFITGGKEENE
ncbi:MAG: PD-(D/E)XK nuclease family protein [Clostridia bacterium]|nr:PD-(D/E)XK nuclease family protein [Clostridia bacterium]